MTAELEQTLKLQPEYLEARMMGAPEKDALALALQAARERHDAHLQTRREREW